MNIRVEQAVTKSSQHKLEKIQLLSLDVDGVLTDGGIYYADNGNTFRKFNAQDGMGIVQLLNVGIQVTIISAGSPGAIEHRARRLGIEHVYTNISDKLSLLRDLLKDLGLGMEQVAHMGDDINDLPLMEVAGLSIASANAVPKIINVADIVTERKGGDGAVREVCDQILKASGYPMITNHTFNL